MAMEVEFYETESGKTPVANFIDSLDRKSSAKVLRDLDLLAEYAPDLHEPYTKHIEGAIWELRSKLASNIYRIFYFIWQGNRIVLLHGFTKKTYTAFGAEYRKTVFGRLRKTTQITKTMATAKRRNDKNDFE